MKEQYLIRIDGESDKLFSTLRDGKIYFTSRKKKLKGTGTLMALYKKIGNNWIGIRHN